MNEPERIVIEADKPSSHYWKDLWRFRELLLFLAWRDIVVRYKQTVLGIAWAVIRPLLTMIIFVFIFGKVARLPSGGVPYPILVFTGMLQWQFFANALTESSNSLIGSTNLITKVYFPRLLIPMSAVVVCFVDFLISYLILIALFFWYSFLPSGMLFLSLVFSVLTFLLAIGTGLWFAALNVRYRDFRYVVPFVVQIGLYVSPVGFSGNVIPGKYQLVYSLNPMVGIIEGFRWSMFEKQPFPLESCGMSFLITVVFLLGGIRYFRKTERYFSDII